jgi:glutaredoxin
MNTKINLIAIIAIALLSAAPAAQAEGVIRWVDSAGRVHYSDMPPPPDAKKVEERMMKGNRIEMDKLPYATRQAAERYPVTLYTQAEGCAPCGQARQYLQTRGVPFSEVSIASEGEAEQAAKMLGKASPKEIVVPSLVVGGKPYDGYLESGWAAALTAAGYPAKSR